MTQTHHSTRGAWIVALLALGLYAGSGALTPLSNNDVWIHLTTGRLILEEGSVPTQDRYSFTAAGNRYVAHEWLAACIYALGEKWGGVPGVIVVGKLLPTLALVAAFLAAVAAAGGRAGTGLLLGVLAFTVARHRILARPELMALVLLLSVLALLLRNRLGPNARPGDRPELRMLWLVPLQVIWVNVHGSFPLGPGLVLLFAAVEAGNDLLDRDGPGFRVAHGLLVVFGATLAYWLSGVEPAAFGRPASVVVAAGSLLLAVDGGFKCFADAGTGSLGRAGWLVGLALLMVLACLVNPLGSGIFLFPFEFTAASSLVTSKIREWRPLFDAGLLQSSLALPSYLFALAVAGFCFARAASQGTLRRLDVALILVLMLLPLRHARWMALTALAAMPCLAITLDLGWNRRAPRGTSQRLLALAFGLAGAAALAVALRMLSGIGDPALIATALTGLGCGVLAVLRAWRPAAGDGFGFAAGALAAGGLTLLGVIHGIPELPGTASSRRPGFGVRSQEPLGAVAFLAKHGVRGRLFTEYEWAGYAIHQLWPDVTVFLDSRSEVYPTELLASYPRIMASYKVAERVLATHGVDLVMVRHVPHPDRSPRGAGILRSLGQGTDWKLLYLDDGALLYGRAFEGRPLPTPYLVLDPRHLLPGDKRYGDSRFEADVRRALGDAPDSVVLRHALAKNLRLRGEDALARAAVEEAWNLQPGYAPLSQLAGELARDRGDPDAARVWFERALLATPGWGIAERSLADLAP